MSDLPPDTTPDTFGFIEPPAATSPGGFNDFGDPNAPPDEVLPPQNSAADLPGLLKQWLGQVPAQHQEWAQAASTIVNDFVTRRDIADNATAQADDFVNSVRRFGDGLMAAVRADPTATNMALGLTALTVPALVNDHPYLDDATRPTVANQLAGEIGQNVARHAVLAWAQRSPDEAHNELTRLAPLFSGEQVDALRGHIDLLAGAQEQDQAGAVAQAQGAADAFSARQTAAYVDELVGPDGRPQFPAQWVQRVVNDQTVSPADTAVAKQIHDRLLAQAQGQLVPPATDGKAVSDFLGRARQGQAGLRELATGAATGMISVQDAQALATAIRNPQDLAVLSGRVDTLRQALAGPDGELTAEDSKNAFSLGVEQLLKGYARGGAGMFDPASKNFMGQLHDWSVREANRQQAQLGRRAEVEQAQERRLQLHEIFSRQRQQAQEERIGAERQSFKLEHQLSAVHRQQQEQKAQAIADERAKARDERINAINLARQQRADAQAFAMSQRLAERDEQRHQGIAREAGRAMRGGAPSTAAPETFRRFFRLGRGRE